jgi:hypothetical protein
MKSGNKYTVLPALVVGFALLAIIFVFGSWWERYGEFDFNDVGQKNYLYAIGVCILVILSALFSNVQRRFASNALLVVAFVFAIYTGLRMVGLELPVLF